MFSTAILALLISSFSFIPGYDKGIKLNGVLDKEEWAEAKIHNLSAGGQVYILQNDQEVYIGIKGTTPGWAHVYLQWNDSVRILHASAALGDQVYTKGTAGWNLRKKFNWELRDKVYDDALVQKQENYFAANGWVGTTNGMGDRLSFEFRIGLQNFKRSALSFAVVITPDAKAMSCYPAALKDDTLLEQLVKGDSPNTLQFRPSEWVRLKE